MDEMSPPEKSSKKMWIWIIAMVVVLLLAFYMFKGDKSSTDTTNTNTNQNNQVGDEISQLDIGESPDTGLDNIDSLLISNEEL